MKPRLFEVMAVVALVGLGLFLNAALSADSAPADRVELRLPPPATSGGMSLAEALAKRRTLRTFTEASVSREQIAQLCWAAQGITEPQRGLRTAPSAMAQHPITVFVADADGLHEYLPKAHALARRPEGDLAKLRLLTGQGPISAAPVCLILTMDVEKMRPRGGEQSERYCLLEAGHVAQNVLLQAAALGLAGVPVGGVDEAKLMKGLGLPSNLRPAYLLPIGHPKP